MLYHLYQFLADVDIPGLGLMKYLTFRTLMAALTSMLLTLIFGEKFIRIIQRKQIGEEIRDLGLEGQLSKKGTPTMGGVIIILATLCGVLLWEDLTNIYTILLTVTLLWLGMLGFIDDYIKVFKHNKNGMSEKAKLIGQISLGLAIGLTVCYSPKIKVREEVPASVRTEYSIDEDGTVHESVSTIKADIVKSTKTTIPFVKDHEFDYKWLSPLKGKWNWWSKWAIYLIMIVIVITACSNSVNLTDGLDGLAAGTTAISSAVLLIFAYLSGNVIQAGYLNIMFIPGAGEAAVFMGAVIGALIGFLWYNSYPAQIFMGDTGSLALGGVIGVCAILIRKELLLPILCGVFFVEALSVIIQRSYFKFTKKKYGQGRRFFKMAPLHHHFQKEGIKAVISAPVQVRPEAKITVRFWIIQVILAVITIALLKIR